MYPGFAWLMRRVLDLLIEFIGPLYIRLPQLPNHCHAVIFFDWTLTTPLLCCTPLYSFSSDLNYNRLLSDLNGLLYSVTVPTETPVAPTATCRFPGIYLRETTFLFLSQETCSVASWFPRIHLYGNVFVTRSLATGLHVSIIQMTCSIMYWTECRIEVVSFSLNLRQNPGWRTGCSELRRGFLQSSRQIPRAYLKICPG
jgi:hypothetical protein